MTLDANHLPLGGPHRVERRVEHLFRREASRLQAALLARLGPARFDLAEEAVQEALVKALRRWPYHGEPADPGGWLLAVARNFALDQLRREARGGAKHAELLRAQAALAQTAVPREPRLAGEITDDELRAMFLCCHPVLPVEARVALTLRTVCALGTEEIARAFLTPPATIAQRLVRAKRRLREGGVKLDLPAPATLDERLDAVLDAIYLLFNEGYYATAGDHLVRADLMQEALRLTRALVASAVGDQPRSHALLALLLFQSSRTAARQGADGEPVVLARQDRGRWDTTQIAAGFHHLARAARGNQESPFHLQAAIASHHARAADGSDTDWAAICALYDRLMALAPSPLVAVNRAVALARAVGAAAGLAALDECAGFPELTGYLAYHLARAELAAEIGHFDTAALAFDRAAAVANHAVERAFLGRRRAELLPERVPALG